MGTKCAPFNGAHMGNAILYVSSASVICSSTKAMSVQHNTASLPSMTLTLGGKAVVRNSRSQKPVNRNQTEKEVWSQIQFFDSSKWACDQRVGINVSLCLAVFWSVCLHISKTACPKLQNFLYLLPMAVARSTSDNSAIRYILPVLRMTSCFHIMVHIQWLRGSRATRHPCLSNIDSPADGNKRFYWVAWREAYGVKSTVSNYLVLTSHLSQNKVQPRIAPYEVVCYCCWLRLADSGYATFWRPSVRLSSDVEKLHTLKTGGLSVARG